jgi:hypothetical protein
MWPSKWMRIENEPELLAQCRGLRGQVWEYQIGHSQLLVRFHRESSLAGIYLYCKSCDVVHFDAYWLDSDVRFVQSPGKYGPIFTVTDGDHLRVVCSVAFIAESPEFISIPRLNDAT